MSALVEAIRPFGDRMSAGEISQALLRSHSWEDRSLSLLERKELLYNAACALKQAWDDLNDHTHAPISKKNRPALA